MDYLMEMFRAQAPGQLPFGKAADRRDVFKSFRPTVVQLAHLMTPFLDKVDTAADVLPLPKGISLSLCGENDQLRISLSEVYAKRFRRAYGYIGEIKLELLYLGRFYFSSRCFLGGPGCPPYRWRGDLDTCTAPVGGPNTMALWELTCRDYCFTHLCAGAGVR